MSAAIPADLADKFAITEQLYRYCRSVDRLDVPLGQSIFHDEATVDYGANGFRGRGHDAIQWICAAHRQLQSHSHQISNILITVEGNHAGSEAYVTASLRAEREGVIRHMEVWARYCDRWSCRDGIWRIDHRDAVIDYDSAREVMPMYRHDWARRDQDDPSYAALGAR